MTSESLSLSSSRMESRATHRLKQLSYHKMEHVYDIVEKCDGSLSRAAAYLTREAELTEQRRNKKPSHTSRAQRQTQSISLQRDPLTKKIAVKINTAHSTPAVDPITGLTWQQKRQQRQLKRQQQQQQLSAEWKEKIARLMEAHVPERLILPLLRKYDGDVDAILAYHAAYHQQRVATKHRASQQRIKKSYADTTLVRSCAAEERMLLANEPTLSGHIYDGAVV